ncbi:hypothetical protein J1605_010825 [Eschrichtius robustus]|uniref:HSR domain-containing protein n=1 Tax=Eschrichtius robustus TaxID=9764 RepID=A0AB34GRE6_ESCRO|nr:hypothetical protein J1605_010825 [Eschrichtius robustus]
MTRALKEALLQHFIHQKLEIAYAINKPFPFFEGLRDNFFITESLYQGNGMQKAQGLGVSEPGAHVQPSAEILHEQPSPAGLTVALPGIIQEGRLAPGEKQTLSNTCAAPA